MNIHEMTEEECRAMLSRGNVVRLACALNNQPYIVPIHIDLEGDFLYGYATLGQKIDWMRQNPLVCLESDELISHGQWASVIVSGRTKNCPTLPSMQASDGSPSASFRGIPCGGSPPRFRSPGTTLADRSCSAFESAARPAVGRRRCRARRTFVGTGRKQRRPG